MRLAKADGFANGIEAIPRAGRGVLEQSAMLHDVAGALCTAAGRARQAG